ncbi:MAG: MFS transporter [Thermodesulfobacteriota bacterium]|nr:MFS transporter [Thermodesulfobacteriota bacterium]
MKADTREINKSDVLPEKSIVISVMMTSFLTTFIGSSTNLALPLIGEEFAGSALALSWIVTGYILASAVFLLPMGRIADIVGRKKIFLLGTAGFTLFTFLCAVSWSNASLIFFRIVQGLTASMIYATGMAIISSAYPANQRGKAMGLAVTATYTGLSLGPVFGGFICQHLGWRSIFYFTAFVGLASVVFIMTRVRDKWVGGQREKFDLAGGMLYMFGIAALLYGMSSIYSTPWAKYILIAGVILMTGFIFLESRIPFPLISLRLFSHNTVFAFSNLAAMINYSATFAIGFLLSLYLQIIRGYSPQTAGVVLLAQPVIMALFSSFAGSLSDRIEPRLVASCGMGLNALGLFLFALLGLATPAWMVALNLAIIGLGFALFSSPNTNAIMGSVSEQFYGVAASTVSTMRMIGMAMSMAVVTLLIALFVGDESLSQTDPVLFLTSLRIAFTVFGILCAGGIVASLARGNVRSS